MTPTRALEFYSGIGACVILMLNCNDVDRRDRGTSYGVEKEQRQCHSRSGF